MAASLQLPAPLVLLSRHSERAGCLGCRPAAARLPSGSDINSKSCFSLEICEGPKRSWTGSVVPNSPRRCWPMLLCDQEAQARSVWVSANFVYRVAGMKHERADQLRSSREVQKSFARRTQPEAIGGISRIGIREKVYDSTKLAAIFDTLVHQGVSAEEILRGVTIRSEDVHSPKTRISLGQLMTAYQNAIRLSADRHLPYRVGTTIHVSTYGMYGYAILCCPDFRKAMDFATTYHALAAPLATIDF